MDDDRRWWTLLISYFFILTASGLVVFVMSDDSAAKRDLKDIVDNNESTTDFTKLLEDTNTRDVVREILEAESDSYREQRELAGQAFNITLGALLGFLSGTASLMGVKANMHESSNKKNEQVASASPIYSGSSENPDEDSI